MSVKDSYTEVYGLLPEYLVCHEMLIYCQLFSLMCLQCTGRPLYGDQPLSLASEGKESEEHY